ncbi:MAG: DUF6456 domain-containing protein [Hyphomonadaceae bacterium]|nr:DUF6456 domain-containing protein [Hyphomonadaceae bacterium]
MSADGAMPGVIPGPGLPWAQRAARIERVLGVSGRRLVESAEGWVVIANTDKRRRPVLRLAAEEAVRLVADGKVVPARRGGGYVSAAPAVSDGSSPETPAAGPWLFAAAGIGKAQAKGRDFAALALAAFAGNGPLSMRQASAGLKLIEDAEQASRDPALTMNWEAGPVDRQRRSGGAPAGPRAAVAAGRRLMRIRDAMRESGPVFPIVWAACVQQAPLLALRRRFDLKKEAVVEALGDALEKLADAYDG